MMNTEIHLAVLQLKELLKNASSFTEREVAVRVSLSHLHSATDRVELCTCLLREHLPYMELIISFALESIVLHARSLDAPHGFNSEQRRHIIDHLRAICCGAVFRQAEPILIKVRSILGDKQILPECRSILRETYSPAHEYVLQALMIANTSEASTTSASHIYECDSDKCRYTAALAAVWNDDLSSAERESVEHYLLEQSNPRSDIHRIKRLFSLALLGNAAARSELAVYLNEANSYETVAIIRSLVSQRFDRSADEREWKAQLHKWVTTPYELQKALFVPFSSVC